MIKRKGDPKMNRVIYILYNFFIGIIIGIAIGNILMFIALAIFHPEMLKIF